MTRQAKIELDDGKEFTQTIEVESYSDSQRWIRAIKTLLTFSTVAVVCILIPVAHFLLVPGFAIFALYNFRTKLKEVARVSAGKLSCPRCSIPIGKRELFFDDTLRVRIFCSGCRAFLRIQV